MHCDVYMFTDCMRCPFIALCLHFAAESKVSSSLTVAVSAPTSSNITTCAQATSALTQSPTQTTALVSQLVSNVSVPANATITVTGVSCTQSNSTAVKAAEKVEATTDFFFTLNYTISSLYGQQAVQVRGGSSACVCTSGWDVCLYILGPLPCCPPSPCRQPGSLESFL